MDDVQASVGFEVEEVAQVSMGAEQWKKREMHEKHEQTGGDGGEGRREREGVMRRKRILRHKRKWDE